MKNALYLLAFVPFLFSCSSEPEKDPVKDSLTNANSNLQGVNETQAAALDSFFRAMNDIQANLDEIKTKEKIITTDTAKGDVSSRSSQITADISAIYDLMVKNKQKLATAKKQLKTSNLQIASMQETIDNLTKELADREVEITDLRDQLQALNLELSNLSMNYTEVQQQSDAQNAELHTAYYAFGTSKELTTQGVLTKEGGFIGIGKSQKLAEDLNTKYFTKIDITQLTEIPLNMKKAKLVTTHPATSYSFETGSDGTVTKLKIIDADKFWSVSKFCVIVVE
ncbi:MAG TPA: hypothetical protein VL651_10185 [Bacteroidia bacterium]|jgi:DNA repair exonuclease SbcCD ATPase subunit|nr:hypothetical protein [Bacteroidia bacterium]